MQASKHVQAVYSAVLLGFRIKYMLMDSEFLPMKKHELASTSIIILNTTSANEHVPKIERQILVIK